MFNHFIKAKKIKKSVQRGGITFSDAEMMDIHSKYEYVIDTKNNKVIIMKENEEKKSTDKAGKGTVSRKKVGDKFIPLIDIRNKEANAIFNEFEYLKVLIYDEQIIVEGYSDEAKESKKTFTNNIASLFKGKNKSITKEKSKTNKILSIQEFLDEKQKTVFAFSRKQFNQAVGQQLSFGLDWNISIEEMIPEDYRHCYNTSEIKEQLPIAMKIASFFSGAGLMDEGFKQAGFDIVFALEKNPEAVETYRYNHGDHILCDDIQTFDKNLMENAPVVIGGPPCQGFSAANRQTNYLDNPNNFLVKAYIETIKANENCKVFVLENVPQILTAGDGHFKDEIINSLSEFEISYGILSAAQFGCAQDRKRAIFIGSKIGKIELPEPMYTKDNYKTVGEALAGITEDMPNQQDFSKPKTDTALRMSYVPQGGNWQDIPDELKTNRMLSGNTHSSVYKRLDENKPSITIANPRKSNITHPRKNRILSIRECARLFGLPDTFTFKGKLSAMQQQICNGVPVELAKAIGKKIKIAIEQFNIRNRTKEFSLV